MADLSSSPVATVSSGTPSVEVALGNRKNEIPGRFVGLNHFGYQTVLGKESS